VHPVGRPCPGQRGPGAFNGENLTELVAYHHAIGILNALVLAPIGALVVVGDGVTCWPGCSWWTAWRWPPSTSPSSTRPSPSGSPRGGCRCPASWTNLPGIVISVVFLVLLFPDGRLPTRRWWPLGLAGAVVAVVPTVALAAEAWPLRGPELVTQQGEAPSLVVAMFEITFMAALAVGAVCVVALV
jgi:hypothetical protein